MKPMDSDSTSLISLPGEGNFLHDCMSNWRTSETCLTAWNPGADPELESLSFGAFQELSERAAGWLEEAGVSEKEVVILLVRDPALLMVAFWGAVLRGAVPAILAYPNFKMNREKYASGLQGVTSRTGARLVVIDSGFPPALQEMIHFPTASSLREITWASIDGTDRFGVLPVITPDSPVLLQHSAGTTGLQKGVCLTHRQVLRQLRKLARYLELDRTDCFASWLPLYHDMGLMTSFLLPLAAGLPMVVQSPDDWVVRPVSYLQLVTRFKATRSWLPNFAFSFLSRRVAPPHRIGLDLSSLRSLVNCSEPVTAAAMESFYDAFQEHGLAASALETSYALAENVFAVTHSTRGRLSTRLEVDADYLAMADRVRGWGGADGRSLTLVSSGTCLEHTEVKICDRTGSRVEEQEIGELWIRSDCLFGGYFGSSDWGSRIEEGWFRTGDVGFLHKGELYVLGRLDDVIIIGGRNVHPTDVEELVSGHPAIHPGRAVAFGVRSLETGTQDLVVVAEVNTDGELADALAIEASLRKQIVTHLGFAPRAVRVVKPGWLVKSTAGKPARRATRTRFLEQNSDLVEDYKWNPDPWSN
jgi:acyl-CoA synthetase (AMP-forming)/AMP-acid ligase II